MIRTHGLDELKKLEHYLNSVHPTLKFTMEVSPERINFLDTTLYISRGRNGFVSGGLM